MELSKQLGGCLLYTSMDAYQVTGDLNIYSNEDQYAYDVTVSYQKENQFRVLLKNKTNNHEQIILRNDEGVYVLTPSLNKSFKFQSDWPYNSSQSYILQPLLDDMKNEEDREFKKTENGYEFVTKVNYVSNKNLVKQKIVLDKDLNFKTVEVYDKNGNISISMKFKKIDDNASFKKNYFALNNNMEVARENVKEEKEVSEMDDIIYPMYIPKNTSLESQDKVDKETGERVILTFAGANPFVFVQDFYKRQVLNVVVSIIFLSVIIRYIKTMSILKVKILVLITCLLYTSRCV